MFGKTIRSSKALFLWISVTLLWTLFLIQSDIFISRHHFTNEECLKEILDTSDGHKEMRDLQLFNLYHNLQVSNVEDHGYITGSSVINDDLIVNEQYTSRSKKKLLYHLTSTEEVNITDYKDGRHGNSLLLFLWNTNNINKTVVCGQIKCTITSDRSSMSRANAVIFNVHHLTPIIDLPKDNKPPTQVWILLLLHPLVDFRPDLSPLSGLINWTSTYSDDRELSDLPIRYGMYHIKPQPVNKWPLSPPEIIAPYTPSSHKRRMVAWFVPECRLPLSQTRIVEQLQRRIPVDLYGPCRRLDCGDKGRCFDMLRKHYKFYLAFEKVSCRQYITDQFWYVALQHDVIPIVMGPSRLDYEKVAPPHSFIHINDFPSADDLSRYLQKLSEDNVLYETYFKWKENGFVSLRKPWPVLSEIYWCDLCSALSDRNKISKRHLTLDKWWDYESQCGIV